MDKNLSYLVYTWLIYRGKNEKMLLPMTQYEKIPKIFTHGADAVRLFAEVDVLAILGLHPNRRGGIAALTLGELDTRNAVE